MSTITERICNLEELVTDFIKQTNSAIQELVNCHKQREIELQKFKDNIEAENKTFKNNVEAILRNFTEKAENIHQQNPIKPQKLPEVQKQTRLTLQQSEEEIKAYKEELRLENIETNRQLWKASDKLGDVIEDIISIYISWIIEKEFGVQYVLIKTRLQRQFEVYETEFDLCAFAAGYVFLNSTTNILRNSNVDRFIKDIELFRIIYPEHKDKPLIGILAALYVNESVLIYAENNGFMVLSVGDKILEVINTEGFKPKVW
ncbi:MAG: hypothetical protein L3V56_05995 [Candidatus Magnetoovum sp. WYHC-5]|nr:hypothetical protein [Candidatus Magnetoovum sp. WYHC-5]